MFESKYHRQICSTKSQQRLQALSRWLRKSIQHFSNGRWHIAGGLILHLAAETQEKIVEIVDIINNYSKYSSVVATTVSGVYHVYHNDFTIDSCDWSISHISE